MSNENQEVRIFVALCKCGVNIAGVIDMEELAAYSEKLPGVVDVTTDLSLCTTAGADLIRSHVEDSNANRVLVAACTPKTHEPVFEAVLEDIGLDPSYLEFVNIREHSSLVHKENPKAATNFAKEAVYAAVLRAQVSEKIPIKQVPVTESVLVIGGGVAGIRSALELADQGIKVYLVEQSPTIGGKMSMLDRTFPTDDCSI